MPSPWPSRQHRQAGSVRRAGAAPFDLGCDDTQAVLLRTVTVSPLVECQATFHVDPVASLEGGSGVNRLAEGNNSCPLGRLSPANANAQPNPGPPSRRGAPLGIRNQESVKTAIDAHANVS
jgi:hypothetical protein